jgi:hypothetical protein
MASVLPLKPESPAPILEDGASLRLCETISRWRYEDLPPAVVRVLKSFLIDTLGVIGGAARAPGMAELHARLTRWERDGTATALIGKRRLSPPSAALANGAAAHALDFDDQHDPARVHTNCVVLPTLLATAEDIGGVSGKDFLLAHAIGAELHARLGLACYNSLGKGWHPTMVFGTPAASLAAGRGGGSGGPGREDACRDRRARLRARRPGERPLGAKYRSGRAPARGRRRTRRGVDGARHARLGGISCRAGA